MTSTELKNILKNTAKDFGTPGFDNEFGFGGVDAYAALLASTSCDDGIQNGDETGVDCGGSCPNACNPTGEYMTGNIIGTGDMNATPFAANLVAGFDDGSTLAFQSDQSQERQLFFIVPPGVSVGTYDLVNTSGFSAEYKEFNIKETEYPKYKDYNWEFEVPVDDSYGGKFKIDILKL